MDNVFDPKKLEDLKKIKNSVLLSVSVFLLLVLIFGFISAVYGQVPEQATPASDNLEYAVFVYPDNQLELDTFKALGMDDWVGSIKKAANMLPGPFLREVGTQTWRFRINTNDWVTGNPGLINLLPMPITEGPGWMNWESFNENGFEESERVFVEVNYPLTIQKGGSKSKIEDFSSEVPVRLGIVYDAVAEFVEEDLKTEGLCIDCLLISFTSKGLKNNVFWEDDKTVIFIVRDFNSAVDEKEFILNFAGRYI